MHEDAISLSRDAALGFVGAWGSASEDLTCPALAAAAGAVVDVTIWASPQCLVSR